jgi:iron complex transport system ATP-binding protein
MTLEARNLDFGYGNRRVGSDACLIVRPGEVLCLLGPNGSGKTTLFRTMLGLLPALSGSVWLDGANIGRMPRKNVARRLSYVPQAQSVYFPYTAREIVLMGRVAHVGLLSAPSGRDREAAGTALERMGVDAYADAIFAQLSGGERQLVLIARALAQEAPIIIMDEPTASLDFGNRLRVLRHLRALRDSGIGVLLATHDPDQAFLCADRVALVHRGRLEPAGTPVGIITASNLARIYGAEVTIERVATRAGGERPVCIPADGL